MTTTTTGRSSGLESIDSTSTPSDGTVPRYAWQSLYVGLVATYLGLVLTIAFFTWGGLFAPLSDTMTLVIAAAFIPVAWTMHRILAPRVRRASTASIAVFGIGVTVSMLGSIALITTNLGLVTITGVAPLTVQFAGLGIIGLWMLAIGLLGARTSVLDTRTSIAAVFGGLGYATFPVFDATLGNTPVIYVTSLAALVGYTAFAVLLASAFRSGRITMPARVTDAASEPTPSSPRRSGW